VKRSRAIMGLALLCFSPMAASAVSDHGDDSLSLGRRRRGAGRGRRRLYVCLLGCHLSAAAAAGRKCAALCGYGANPAGGANQRRWAAARIHERYLVTRLRAKAYVLDVRYEKSFESAVTERVKEGFTTAGVPLPRSLHKLEHKNTEPPPAPARGRRLHDL